MSELQLEKKDQARLAREAVSRDDRPIERWLQHRLGKSLDSITVTELREELPRLGGLRYRERSAGNPLGGRVAPHLQHLEEGDALERLERADEFLRADKLRGSAPRRRARSWRRRQTALRRHLTRASNKS